jgi:predicted nucleotidyltransferase
VIVPAGDLYYYVLMSRESVLEILRGYRRRFIRAYVFGSVARGEQDEYSDIDIIMVRATELPFPERGKELLSLLRELGGADLLIYTVDEFNRQMEIGGFVYHVVKEAIQVEGEQKGSAEVVETSRE